MIQHSSSNKIPAHEEDSIAIIDLVLALVRQLKILIIIPTVFCIVAIFHVTFLAKPTFTSTAKIMSSSGGGKMSQAAGLAAQFGINIGSGQAETKWVYPEIIKSRTLARSMLKRKFDTEKFGLQKSLFQILNHGNENDNLELDKARIKAVDSFLGMIEISEEIKTGIFTLSINSFEAVLSSEINKALIEELGTHQQTYNKEKTSKTRQFIEERIISTEKDLNDAENKLKEFMDRNRRIENSPALQLEQQRLNREVTVLIGVFTTLKQQLETTKIEELKELDYVIILDPPEVPLSRSKPKKKRAVIFAGILGIGLGILIGFTRESFAKSGTVGKEKMKEIKTLLLKNILELIPWKSS